MEGRMLEERTGEERVEEVMMMEEPKSVLD